MADALLVAEGRRWPVVPHQGTGEYRSCPLLFVSPGMRPIFAVKTKRSIALVAMLQTFTALLIPIQFI